MQPSHYLAAKAAAAAFLLILPTVPASAATEPATVQSTLPTYADLAGLADSAALVVRAQVRKQLRVENERAPGLRAGWGRFFVQADTSALLSGNQAVGESLAYLVDLPLDADGKPPRLKKQEVLLFARAVPGRPGELQLISPTAQILWDPQTEATLRSILQEMVSPDAPDRITGVREIINVPGTLAGESETQIFLSTADSSAASITVVHRRGSPPAWGVSFSELVADVGNPPRKNTLAWYRLACFLPNALPQRVNLSESRASHQQAESDYRMVLGELGVCRRNRS